MYSVKNYHSFRAKSMAEMRIRMNRQYIAAAQTDIGLVKNINQDSLTVKVANINGEQIVLAVLCDGMGGLSQGEVASAHVVLAFELWFNKECAKLISENFTPQELEKSWNNIIYRCNDEIVEYGKKLSTNVGTTLTIMFIYHGNYYISHVGDCRVYELAPQGVCRQLTHDQTFIAREVKLGHITPQQARTDKRRNVLLQCIGVNHSVSPDFICGKLAKDAFYLLCSDGFRHEITKDEIYQCCFINLHAASCQEQLKMRKVMNQQIAYLIELNKNRNERDNISAILIGVCDENK